MNKRQVNPGAAENAAERRLKSLELRKNGASYRQIGVALGVATDTAWKDVIRSLADLAKIEMGMAAELRALETERLDMALLSLAKGVRDGNLGAIDRWIRLSESRRKLLGLDMPAKIAQTTPDGEEAHAEPGVADVAGWLARLAAGLHAADLPGQPDA